MQNFENYFRFALGEFVETHALGGGVFPTMANVNHSCDPNFTIVNFLGHHAVAFANRTINKGEELHDTYGAVFYHMDKAERQHYLKVIAFEIPFLSIIHYFIHLLTLSLK